MRDVIRCPNPHCRLNQFRTVSGDCRRCHKPYAVPAPPVVLVPFVPTLKPEHYDVGVALRVLRHWRNLSQRELGELMGTKRSYISKVEHHEIEPTIATLVRMEHALGVEPGTVMLFATGACQRIQ